MVTPTKLIDGAAVNNGAVTTMYTVVANQALLLKKLVFNNPTGGAILVTIAINGITIRAKTLAPAEAFECFEGENQVLVAGDTIGAGANAANVTCRASGLLITS